MKRKFMQYKQILPFSALAICALLAAPVTVLAQETTGKSALAGTQWELVTIQSMNDTENTPDDPSSYTLNFSEDGTVSLQSDCNRALGE